MMDNDNVDPRVFMRNCDSMIDPRTSVRYSVNNTPVTPAISRSLSYHTQISAKNEIPITLQEEQNAPLKRQASAKFRPINHKKHSCTDVHCLLIFICFIIGWIYIATYALSQGNLNKLLIPTDSKNAKCGLDSGVRDKKMLFFYNLDKCLDPLTPITGCNTKQICVKECPKTSFIWQENTDQTNLSTLKEKLICDSTVNKQKLKSLLDVKKSIENDLCSGWYLESKPLFNHCVWDLSDELCEILPKKLTGRNRRSDLTPVNFIDFKPVATKLAEFGKSIKSVCNKQHHNTSSNMIAFKEKIKKTNSNFNRIIAAIISKFNYSGKEILAEHIADDLKNSWKVIVFAFFIHLFAVLLFITLLRWLAEPLVWVSICGVIFGLGYSFYYSFRQYRLWSTEAHVPKHATNLQAKVQNILENGDVWLYVTMILGALLTIIVLIVIVIRKRIKIAVAIIKEASRAITNIKSSIFFPIFPAILNILVATMSIIILLHLGSIGDYSFIMARRNITETTEQCVCTGPELQKPYKLGDACDPALFEEYCRNENNELCMQTSCSFNEIIKDRKTNWFMLLNIFGVLWVTFFISAYEDMVLACTFSLWYWTFNKKNIPKFPLLKAMWITTVYHLGTLAFGALVLSICRMIRYMLELIEKKAKAYNNTITRAILCCMKFFFWLLENFLRFLNRNAYITCAIHSTSFCESSRKAFSLITQNLLRVYAVDKVSDFLFFLSKILVTGCTSFTTFIALKAYPDIIIIHYPEVPVALVAILSYIMAHFIFSTYSMAVDTLFFCFLQDSTENDGSAENPFFMSKELRKLLGKSKIKRKKLQG
ncbi:choline transporter-like 2 [Lucilia cuprina]|uniref:choline transporter-like 2 n=1 Tax=Lucilia cuprina TaxID=7375 RepID=UPI001F062783|nr:choline transporter-like 2 [Lucilia cuprina]